MYHSTFHQCSGSVTFEDGPDPDPWIHSPDPDPALFVIDFKVTNKNKFFGLLLTLGR
jgi:hypothetical protein